MKNVIVVGGGAAGMMAAIWAARSGASVAIYEKNEKLGKKLFITGKGRCNFTNACDTEELFKSVCTNPKFLYSAFYSFDNHAVMAFFKELGLAYKVERGERVFPESDKSSDVIRALESELKRLGVWIVLNSRVKGLLIDAVKVSANTGVGNTKALIFANRCKGIVDETGKRIEADAVILCGGGLAYPSTGAVDDSLRFARECGHKIITTYPSLVPFEVKEKWAKELMGLSLKNVSLTVKCGKKKIYEDFGEMLFTHFGVSGPLVLSASTAVHRYLSDGLTLFIDLKPALNKEQLDARVLKDFEKNNNKDFINALDELLPKRLIEVVVGLSGIDPHKKVNQISKAERETLVEILKNLPLTVTGLRDYNEAIITKGGVSVKDINPSTMESKLVKDLYFAGEMIDVDALTGGFNLQIAWSTGYLAGLNAGE